MKHNLKFEISAREGAKMYYTNINQRDYFLDKETCRLVNDIGAKGLREVFDERIKISTPHCSSLSYGHLASIGADIVFPDNSEPNAVPMFSSIEDGIKWLKRDFNFTDCDMFKHYYDMYLYLKESFPNEPVVFSGYGYQGPITSAVLLRGQDFYLDVYDKPELVKEYLDLLTQSIIKFSRFLRIINGLGLMDKKTGYVSDDFASLLSPEQWKTFVNPYFDMFYKATTTGERRTHVENLVPAHMKRLVELGIVYFDPSVSRALSSAIIIEEAPDLYFSWRLLGIDIGYMSVKDIENWVIDNVKQGAPQLHTIISKEYCKPGNPEKAYAFIDTCERIQREGL